MIDENIVNSSFYQRFLRENPAIGFLKIRAYAASGAIPISNLKVVISKNIENNNVTFYEGYTNESGVIERINLPAPVINKNNLNAPNYVTYDLTTTYQQGNIVSKYKVNIYDNLYVIQNINVAPASSIELQMGGFNGN